MSGRVGMSPVMVGRARPFARLAGIVDAADVMTSEQPAVALVSGEAVIGKTRLVRELVESLPSRFNTRCTAGRANMRSVKAPKAFNSSTGYLAMRPQPFE